MATLAVGAVVSVYCPLSGTMTVTPGTSGRVSINARGRDGSQSLAPRELYTAETLTVNAGDTVGLEAINAAATYTDPAVDGAALLRGGFALAQRGAPASVTGTTAETLLCPAIVIPAGCMGLNGMLRIESAWTSSATTNNRIHTIKIGSTTIFTRTRNTAASISEVPLILLQNRGSLAAQLSITTAGLNYGSNLTTVPGTLTLDFSTDQNLYFYGQLGSSGDTLTLEAYNIRVETAA